MKMSYKSAVVPEGYYHYTVFPLEGVWDLVDVEQGVLDKSNYQYDIMMRQPDFLTQELFARFVAEAKKKPNPYLDRAVLSTIDEGLCCQMMHIGSYDSEPESFRLMEDYCKARATVGYLRLTARFTSPIRDAPPQRGSRLCCVLPFYPSLSLMPPRTGCCTVPHRNRSWPEAPRVYRFPQCRPRS